MRKPLHAKLLPSKLYPSFEHLDCSISTSKLHLRFIIIYRPPPSAKNKLTAKTFIDEFTTFLVSLAVHPGNIIMCGDFNVHMDVQDDPLARRLGDIIESFGLKQHVTGSTHKAGHTLDLLISRAESDLVESCAISDPGISDHSAINFNLRLPGPPHLTKTITFRKINSINHSAFSDSLTSSPTTLTISENINDIVLSYNSTLISALDLHAPIRTKTVTVRPECVISQAQSAQAGASEEPLRPHCPYPNFLCCSQYLPTFPHCG